MKVSSYTAYIAVFARDVYDFALWLVKIDGYRDLLVVIEIVICSH